MANTRHLSLSRLRRVVNAVMAMAMAKATPTGGIGSEHSRYPEWKAKRRSRGKRDASLKQRSNRRKAARRA